jgi:hypothetical protein
MASIRIEHDFDCTEATLWKVTFLDSEFNRRLFLEALKFPGWKVLDEKITDDALERKVQVSPPVENLPGPLKKAMGDRFGYVEEGRLDRKQNRYRFRVIPSAMPDKTHITGELRTEPLGDKRVRRIVEMSVEVKVMMIGKLVEQRTLDDTRASYDKAAVFIRQYLKEKGLENT